MELRWQQGATTQALVRVQHKNGGGVLAYTFGPRTDETCRELLALLTPFNIGMLTTDEWGSYTRELPKEKHLTGGSDSNLLIVFYVQIMPDDLVMQLHRF